MALDKPTQRAFDAFRDAVHVLYTLPEGHPDRLPHDGAAERLCFGTHAAAERGSTELLDTPTDELVTRKVAADREWRAAHPPRPGVLRFT